MSRSLWARIGAFVLVVALVIGTAGVAGYATAPTAPDRVDATVEKDYFTGETIVEDAQLAARSGRIEMDTQPSRTVLLSTDGSIEDLEPIVRVLVRNGHEVRIHGGGGVTVGSVSGIIAGSAMATSSVSSSSGDLQSQLAEVDALFAVGGSQFQSEDYDTIESFAENGSVVLATDPSGGFAGSASDELTARFGVTVGDGYLYNMQQNDANFQRVYASGGESDLATGVTETVFDTAAPVWGHEADSVLTAGEQTRYAVTRTSGSYDVAVASETALVIGDTDFMTPLDYNRADNNEFLGSVLEYLVDTPENPYTPPAEGETDGPSRPTPDTAYPGTGSGSETATGA